MTNSVLIFNNLPVSKSNLVLMPLFFKILKNNFFYYFIIKSNQIKSFGLGIALGSFMQSGVSIHCVLRFFSPDLYKIVISVTLARIEIIIPAIAGQLATFLAFLPNCTDNAGHLN